MEGTGKKWSALISQVTIQTGYHVYWPRKRLHSVETLVGRQSPNSIQTPCINPGDGFKNTQHFCMCYLDHPSVLATNPRSDFKDDEKREQYFKQWKDLSLCPHGVP